MTAISNRDLRSYGILALPLAVAGLPLYLHAPDFYVTEKGASLLTIGIVLLLVRIIDAVQDPLIGIFSDLYQSYRRQIMLSAVIGLAIGMVCLFLPPGKFVIGWFAFWVVVSTTSYSVISINLNALGGLWSDDHYQRTEIASSRERFGLIGVLIGVMLPGLLAYWFSKSYAFAIFTAALVLILAYCFWKFYNWSLGNTTLFQKAEGSFVGYRPFRLPESPAIRRLIIVTLAGTVASSLPAVLFLFFVRDVLQVESLAWFFLLLYFISALAGVPVWRELSKRIGKVRTWAVSILVAIVSFVAAAYLSSGEIVLYATVCLTTGFALGGDLVFPSSLMADYVNRNTKTRGMASAGYAWLSFVQKAGLGIAAGVALPILDRLGFESGSVNPPSALLGLVLLYAAVPMLLKGISLGMLWSWKDELEGNEIDEKEMDNNLCRAANADTDTNWM